MGVEDYIGSSIYVPDGLIRKEKEDKKKYRIVGTEMVGWNNIHQKEGKETEIYYREAGGQWKEFYYFLEEE